MRRASAGGAGNFSWPWMAAVVIAVMVFVASVAVGAEEAKQDASTQPVSSSPTDSIKLSRPALASPGERANGDSASALSVGRVLWALAIVLGAILGLRWVGRRFLGMSTGLSLSGPIQVLCRSPISPRQQLMLVQVGRKLVLVANCGTQMNALCEITDPEEVAGLQGQLRQRKGEAGGGSFMSLIRRAGSFYEKNEPAGQEVAEPARSEESNDGDLPLVTATREEIGGLSEKVRMLAKALKRA